MAVLTITERLENIQTLIQEVETGGQAYTKGNRQLTRADLKTLYAQEALLIEVYGDTVQGRARNYFQAKDAL